MLPLRVFLVLVCILHFVIGIIEIIISLSSEYGGNFGLVLPIFSILLGMIGILFSMYKDLFVLGIFAGGMLIFMGFNAAGAAALMDYMFYNASSYAAYIMEVAMSVIEAFAFIASLLYAKIIKSENKIIIESSNAPPRNAVPTNK